MPEASGHEHHAPLRSNSRTLSVLVPVDLAQQMIDYCRRSGVGMSSAVSEALRAFLAQESQDAATAC